MKKIATLIGLCLALPLLASVVILFDPGTGRNLRRIDSADTTVYTGASNALINPVLPTNALNTCYATNGQVLPIPQAWLDAEYLTSWLASSNATWNYQQAQNSNAFWTAMNFFSDNTNTVPLVMTALAMETLRQHNMWRATNGLPDMSAFAMITKIVSNINFLKTNQ